MRDETFVASQPRHDPPAADPDETPAPTLHAIAAQERPQARRAAWLSVVAALIWVPQAALLAAGVAALAGGSGFPYAAAAGIVALAVLRAAIGMAAARLAAGAAGRAVSRARQAVTRAAATRAPSDAGRTPSGLLAVLGADQVEAVDPWLRRFQPARLRAVAVPVVIVFAVGYVSWAAALALLLAGPVIPVFMALIGTAAKAAAADQAAGQGTLSALLLDRLRAASEIRLLDATERVAADFEAAAARLRGQTMAVLRIAFLSSTVLELFAAIGVALVAVYVGFSLLGMLDFGTWRGALSLGDGLFILMLAPAFFEPLRDLAAAWHDRATFEAVADRFAAAVAAGPRLLGTGHAAAPLPGAPDIVFEAVTAPQAGLSAADWAFPAGARIAITGPSGAGKSTLLALIAGLAEPDDGTIRVAGEPLDATTADAWRARLAWIGQRPHFIAGSLRANVALAGDAADREGVRDALSIAAAADVAARIPRGLDARIGETGHGVSGGEARRLAVARAAYAGRDVILADEPTADLDSETATAVTDGLLRLADGGATLIVATHDAALAARMDREIRLGGTP